MVTFSELRRDRDAAPWPHVSISTTASLHFVLKLLRCNNEQEVSSQVEVILKKFAKMIEPPEGE